MRFLAVAVLAAMMLIACTGAAPPVAPPADEPSEPAAGDPPVDQPLAAEPAPGGGDPPVVVGGGTAVPADAFPVAVPEGVTRVYLSSGAVSTGRLARSVAARESVQEGDSFRVRVSFDGARPTDGGCDILAADSQTGNHDTTHAYANGEDVSSLFIAEHTDAADDGRYIRVTLTDCTFPDLDEQGIAYQIGNSALDVTVTTAGPITNPDTTTYAITVSNLRWDDSLDHHGNSSYFLYRFDWTINTAPPIDLSLGVHHHDGSEHPESTNYVHIFAGHTSGTEGYTTAKSAPGTQRTVTITPQDVIPQVTLGTPSPPPVDYTLNTDPISATMTVFEWSIPNTVVTFDSLTGPATNGGTVTATLSATDRPTDVDIWVYFRAYDSWLRGDGGYLGDYRTWHPNAPNPKAFSIDVPECCAPHGTAPHQQRFRPEAERTTPRIITVTAIYKGTSTTETIEVQ